MQPTLMEPIYCRQCGHILQPGQHYCPSCGTAIRMIASQPSLPAPAPVQSSTPSPRTRKLPSAGILIAIAIALFVLASFLYTTVKMVVAFDPAIVLSARGTCQIKVSRVEHFYNPWVQADSSNVQARLARNEEKAQVTYTLLTTDGRAFQGSSYDWMDDVRVDEGWDQAQAIVNQYGVGHS